MALPSKLYTDYVFKASEWSASVTYPVDAVVYVSIAGASFGRFFKNTTGSASLNSLAGWTEVSGFTFKTRDPAQEMSYTAQTLAELMKADGYWAQAETNVGVVLTDRFVTAVDAVGAQAKSQFDEIKDSIKTELYGVSPANEGVAFSQFLAGMSAAMGGGHASVSYFSNVATQEQQLKVLTSSAQIAQTVVGTAFQATSAMPLVVPLESQLISDACASGVESHNIGSIRDQQIRQSVSAGLRLFASVDNSIINGHINIPAFDEKIAVASINAQGAAARTT
jgi:hypothetical protein